MHILLIESDTQNQTKSLFAHLTRQQHTVSLVHSPERAAAQAAGLWPNLILLNTAAGELDLSRFGPLFEASSKIPCFIIGDQPAPPDEFDGQVLPVGQVAQLNAMLRDLDGRQKDRFVRLPGLVIDRQYRRILRGGTIYSLTPKEFKLLFLLVDNANEILSRKAIMQHVWETDYMGDTRTLDVHIRWLREKIEENPSRPTQLVTIRGVGYRFVINAD
ncbi:MAG: response regulator transcription factor [Anaerolineae bacterium]